MLHTIMTGIICSFAFLNYSFIITSFRDEANCGFKSFVPSLIYQNVGSNMKKKKCFPTYLGLFVIRVSGGSLSKKDRCI